MHGSVYQLLAADHARLDALLIACAADPAGGGSEPYEEFRAGLLRHIAMEEKVLLPDAARRQGAPLPVAKQLRAEHGVIAKLLVPTPTPAIIQALQDLLAAHNALEEGPAGVYTVCEQLAGTEAPDLVARLIAVPPVPPAPHHDGPSIQAFVARYTQRNPRK